MRACIHNDYLMIYICIKRHAYPLAWLSALQRPKLLTGSRFRPCLLIYTTRVQYCTEHGFFLPPSDAGT
jgi:hypothetical protein